MVKISRSVVINAPVEKVFEYATNPESLLEFWPSMVEVKDVHAGQGVGDNYRWVYKMAGMRLEGQAECVEYTVNEHVTMKNTGGVPSTFVWNYSPENGGTKVTMEAEYTIPVPLLSKLAEAFIVKGNEHEADALMANLKARMES
jgi:coenzyme Q-binding protein COQ10